MVRIPPNSTYLFEILTIYPWGNPAQTDVLKGTCVSSKEGGIMIRDILQNGPALCPSVEKDAMIVPAILSGYFEDLMLKKILA